MKTRSQQIFILILCLVATLMAAKLEAKSASKKSPKTLVQNPRVATLDSEQKMLFNDLTKKQQKMILDQQIQPGFNSWMVELALGKPYYKSEHHPVYQDYEQVWLYTKLDVIKDEVKNQVKDDATGWPMEHTITKTKSCQVGDFFVLFDRGVVDHIVKDGSKKTYGSCTIETQEAFIPMKR